MRTAFVLWLAAGLSGCAVVPPAAWHFDPAQPAPQVELPPQQLALLTQLRIERSAIRARIAGERDVLQRVALYRQLHRVGMELSLLERQLGTG